MQRAQYPAVEWNHLGFLASKAGEQAARAAAFASSGCSASGHLKLKPRAASQSPTARCRPCPSWPVLDSILDGATRPWPDANYRLSISTKGTSLRQGPDVHKNQEWVAAGSVTTSEIFASLALAADNSAPMKRSAKRWALATSPQPTFLLIVGQARHWPVRSRLTLLAFRHCRAPENLWD